EVMAQYAMARALSEQVEIRYARGDRVSMADVIAAYRRVIDLDPLFTWAVNELGDAYLTAATMAQDRGENYRPLLEAALAQFERASAMDPAFLLPATQRVRVLSYLAQDEIGRDDVAGEHISALLAAVAALEPRMGPGSAWVAAKKTRAYRLKA